MFSAFHSFRDNPVHSVDSFTSGYIPRDRIVFAVRFGVRRSPARLNKLSSRRHRAREPLCCKITKGVYSADAAVQLPYPARVS
ncbi:hypothetical protein LENED_004579 [Lentinula edodes]|uniref:Uncharacterized protein n=1 Tax=Lentinula edodes TaxID=5353 RepID=A0A1Q3E791_LENED|nr:hypothetical protein LENED_004579 [Lentinula edodes]